MSLRCPTCDGPVEEVSDDDDYVFCPICDEEFCVDECDEDYDPLDDEGGQLGAPYDDFEDDEDFLDEEDE